MRKRLAALALIPLLAACGTDRGYWADPVVGPDDAREVDAPDVDDDDATEAQDCFEMTLYEEHAFDLDEHKVGIACIVEPER